MMKRSAVLVVALFILTGCSPPGEPPGADDHDHSPQAEESHLSAVPDEHDHPRELTVTADRQREWGVQVDEARLEAVVHEILLPGVLRLNDNRTAYVSSFVEGKISAVYSDLGQPVRKGEHLLIVNSPEFAQAQADFLEARVRMILSEAEYKRAKKLLAEKALEEKEYLRREAEYRKLSTEFGALGSRLHSFGITHKQIDALIQECDSLEHMEYKCELADPLLPVLSPLSGRIIFRDAVVGEHIGPEKTLLKVADLSHLWADLDAYEKDIPFIREDSRVTVHTPLYPEKEFEGRILNIHDILDEKLRTIKIRLEVNNEAGLLKPHMYVQGKILSHSDGEKKWMVPDEAVQNLDDGKILFVQEEPDVFFIRHVTVGPRIGKNRVILSGLSAADRVVVKGAFTLKSEMSKGTIGGAHVH